MRSFQTLVGIAVLALGAGCGGSSDRVGAVHDLEAAESEGHFFDHPFPSDLRIDGTGAPRVAGYPNPTGSDLLGDLIGVAADRRGFSAQSTSYFRFDGALFPRAIEEPILATDDAPIILVDIDADSPDRGRRYPVVAQTLAVENAWAPEQVLAVAPYPGIILRGDTTYAVVVRRSVEDADGEHLAAGTELASLSRGSASPAAGGQAALSIYEPLWDELEVLDIEVSDVAAATVFTTGDEVAGLADLSDRILASTSVTLDNLAVTSGGAEHTRFCQLEAPVLMPQYQVGNPPFNSGGLFEIGGDGLPVVQRYEETQIALALPKTTMPAAGYPLMIYFHGSGGVALTAIDRGHFDGESYAAGEGPAFVVAEHGIATIAASLPLSPDRLPGASDIEYLNFSNLAAFRDTFRQGIIESRLLLSATLDIEIEPSVVEDCGLAAPESGTTYRFDAGAIVASGQSMGGMYTTLFSPVDSRVRAAVPTGAGGHWNRMIISTDVVPGGRDLLSVLIRTDPETMSFVHPGLNLLSLGWEVAEPFVFMPRIARRPLPGHEPVPLYQPVGREDGYFDSEIFDAAAIAYGNQLAGAEVWPGMREALAIVGDDAAAAYPASHNRESEEGISYTGVVVQYDNDGIQDGHYIYAQLDEVKYQYGCFLATLLNGGRGVVPEPAQLGTQCPQ